MNKVLWDFINSDLTEADYFGYSKDDLITIKDYFLSMQKKDEEFKKLIKEPLDSMKDKCGWINDLGYTMLQQSETGEYISSALYLFPNEGKNLIIRKRYDSDDYTELAEKFPKFYLFNKAIRERYERQKEIPLIQDELREIDKIGQSFYDGQLHAKNSVSEIFQIYYVPNMRMEVYLPSDQEVMAYYHINKMKEYDKPLLNEEQKEKVLTKIQIRK